MSREYKIDVIVDDHGAAQQLHEVAAAEDHVTASASKAGDGLDVFNKKTSDTVNVTKQVQQALTAKDAALREATKSWGAITISETEADYALSALHVNLAQTPGLLTSVRGSLNDVATGAGLTFTALGALASAASVVGVAWVAWDIGRAIANFFDLDTAIANNTASVLGWGNIAKEQAAAGAEALALASQRAGRDITDMTEALKASTEWLDEWNAHWRRVDAPNASRLQIIEWEKAIQKIRDDGVMKSFLADLDSHAFSLKDLAFRYGVTTDAIAYYKKTQAEASAEQSHWNQFVRDGEAAVARQNAEIDKWAAKVKTIEAGGDHAYSTLHQWYGELARDQKYINELIDQHAKKLIEESQAATKFLTDALNAAKALDAEIANNPIGQGPPHLGPDGKWVDGNGKPTSAPTGTGGVIHGTGSDVPSTIEDYLNAIGNGVNISGLGNLLKFLPHFDVGGPINRDGPIMAHAGEYVLNKDDVGALKRGGGAGAVAITIDARGASFEDDRSLDRLVDKIATRMGTRAAQRGV